MSGAGSFQVVSFCQVVPVQAWLAEAWVCCRRWLRGRRRPSAKALSFAQAASAGWPCCGLPGTGLRFRHAGFILCQRLPLPSLRPCCRRAVRGLSNYMFHEAQV